MDRQSEVNTDGEAGERKRVFAYGSRLKGNMCHHLCGCPIRVDDKRRQLKQKIAPPYGPTQSAYVSQDALQGSLSAINSPLGRLTRSLYALASVNNATYQNQPKTYLKCFPRSFWESMSTV